MFVKEDTGFSPFLWISVYMNMLQARDYIARYRPCRTGFPLPAGEIDRRVDTRPCGPSRLHKNFFSRTNFQMLITKLLSTKRYIYIYVFQIYKHIFFLENKIPYSLYCIWSKHTGAFYNSRHERKRERQSALHSFLNFRLSHDYWNLWGRQGGCAQDHSRQLLAPQIHGHRI